MIYIVHKKSKEECILKKYHDALILDISSKGEMPWVKLSPFYPHGGIPVPFSDGVTAMSVEGIWQGLKVFHDVGIDTTKFQITNMVAIKRTTIKYGIPRGHQKGLYCTELLDYSTARKEIYLRTYAWVLDNLLQDVILLLKEKAQQHDIVLLDYNVRDYTGLSIHDIANGNKPISHAGLVKRYLLKQYPELSVYAKITGKYQQKFSLSLPF